MSEILILGGLVFLFWGPERLPELARILSKAIVQFKRFTNDLKSNVKEGIDTIGGDDLKKWEEFQTKVQSQMRTLQGDGLSGYLSTLAKTLDQDKAALQALETVQSDIKKNLSDIEAKLKENSVPEGSLGQIEGFNNTAVKTDSDLLYNSPDVSQSPTTQSKVGVSPIHAEGKEPNRIAPLGSIASLGANMGNKASTPTAPKKTLVETHVYYDI